MATLSSLMAFILSAALIITAIVAGGSSQFGMLSTSVVELASLPLLGFGAWMAMRRRQTGLGWPIGILTVGVIVAAAQLAPLPVELWRDLPGRASMLTTIATVGAHPAALPASLTPNSTARSLVSLVPGAALFLGVAGLNWSQRRQLVWVLVGIGALSAMIGLLQATGRSPSFYHVTNPGSAVGFFANRNHLATLLCACLPFAAAIAIPKHQRGGRAPRANTIVAASLGIILLLGATATGSRAGLVLTLLGLLGFAAIHIQARPRERRPKFWNLLPLVAVALVTLALLQFTRIGALGHEKLGSLDEGRAVVAATTLAAARSYAPIGTGLGSFVPVYAAAEPPDTLSSEYFNHAHNDWVELWLEGGWPMAAVVAGGLCWSASAAARAWRPSASDSSAALAQAASIAIGLMLVHSLVDYPLRTEAMISVFGLACAFLVSPPSARSANNPRDDDTRDHSESAAANRPARHESLARSKV